MVLNNLWSGVYIFYIMYIYANGIVDHSGINFKVIFTASHQFELECFFQPVVSVEDF